MVEKKTTPQKQPAQARRPLETTVAKQLEKTDTKYGSYVMAEAINLAR